MEEMTWKGQVGVHQVNTEISCMFLERFEPYCLEDEDSQLAEHLQYQEIVHHSIQINSANKLGAVDNDRSHSESSTSNAKCHVEHVQLSHENKLEGQFVHEHDEALAKALQELEDQLAVASLDGIAATEEDGSSSVHSSPVSEQSDSANSVIAATGLDDLDPDNMTYEELQSLGEAIGTQSKGLSDAVISCLPSFKYKAGIFSRKDNHNECVICYMKYKNKDTLTILPCKHQYHSTCVSRWLKLNKACPVCNAEVFG